MKRLYRYVGPHDLRRLLDQPTPRCCIERPHDVRAWLEQSHRPGTTLYQVTVTFIIDGDERLWIADQRSEHVVCARGQAIYAAGEITFWLHQTQVDICEISNQSTGYCPEPGSWAVVTAVLERIGLPHPATWTVAYLFRRCQACETINLIKDDWFECAVCGVPLSEHWNFE
ncbi:MAG: hypothetical protein H0T73_06785 [Ardenticatenales bacterium]|nr:hypothetical protein [Ardenticatenales bacterium]